MDILERQILAQTKEEFAHIRSCSGMVTDASIQQEMRPLSLEVTVVPGATWWINGWTWWPSQVQSLKFCDSENKHSYFNQDNREENLSMYWFIILIHRRRRSKTTRSESGDGHFPFLLTERVTAVGCGDLHRVPGWALLATWPPALLGVCEPRSFKTYLVLGGSMQPNKERLNLLLFVYLS